MFRSHLKEIMKKGSKFGLIGPKTVNLIYYKLLHLGVKLIIDKVIFHINVKTCFFSTDLLTW